jgi:hypothetical protein
MIAITQWQGKHWNIFCHWFFELMEPVKKSRLDIGLEEY